MKFGSDADVVYEGEEQAQDLKTRLRRGALRPVDLPSGLRVNFALVSAKALYITGRLPFELLRIADQASKSPATDDASIAQRTLAGARILWAQMAAGIREIWEADVRGWRPVEVSVADLETWDPRDVDALENEVARGSTAEVHDAEAAKAQRAAEREAAGKERYQRRKKEAAAAAETG